MNTVPFLRFLNETRFRSPYARDFRGDALRDRTFPTNLHTWKDLQSHLRARFACRQAIQGAKTAWKHYERFLASR